jgi:hypothetical protein
LEKVLRLVLPSKIYKGYKHTQNEIKNLVSYYLDQSNK